MTNMSHSQSSVHKLCWKSLRSIGCRKIQTAISSLEKQNPLKFEQMRLPKTVVSERTANTENNASDMRTSPLNMSW